MTEKTPSKTISVRVSPGAKRALTVLAHALDMSEKDVASSAVRLFISENKEKVREGLKRASVVNLKDLAAF